MIKYQMMLPKKVEAKQFNNLNDYLEICEWMKENNDTHALAGEVHFNTPIMIMTTIKGFMAANYGDYIIRDEQGWFYPIRRDIFEAVYGKSN